MTIKEFAKLCEAEPHTLRYYDSVGLLKPARVDEHSGYRHYNEDQAADFVKIKNLQRADFSIDEIKKLLKEDARAVHSALEEKKAAFKEKLLKIQDIQVSYQTEMDAIKKKIDEVRRNIDRTLLDFDAEAEFGIDGETYELVKKDVMWFVDQLTVKPGSDSELYFEESDELTITEEEQVTPADPNYELVYENHGWERVKDFFDEFCILEPNSEYALYFELTPEKSENTLSFSASIQTLLFKKNPMKGLGFKVSIFPSGDGLNHFCLLKRR